jgi:phosphoribosyl 1,2-cyclic phosphodiesterase
MSSLPSHFVVKFWGVRGSIASPGAGTVRYGGNTPCVEMQVGQQRLIFDGGTGIRVLGQSLLSQNPMEGHLFFTHSHWDHIQGFPFFLPAFIKGNCFHIYGAIAPDGSDIKQRLNDQMRHPNFPVPLQVMGANLKFYDIEVGETITIGDVTVETGLLNHPGQATGYRVSWGNHAAAYITDTEHFCDRLDESVLRLAHKADVLIYDATYTDEEYHHPKTGKVGWGHSTWQEAVKIAQAAKVKTLVIFHHDPLHDDEFLDQMGIEVAQAFPGAVMAREGMLIQIAPPPYKPSTKKLEAKTVTNSLLTS